MPPSKEIKITFLKPVHCNQGKNPARNPGHTGCTKIQKVKGYYTAKKCPFEA